MSFLHLSLLAGVAAISLPIMLHLFGQRQPQLIDFPALRFVRETTQEQSTSWQLRHILLLLLRILLFAVMAFALTRPRVHSAMLGSIIGVSAVGCFALLASLVAAIALATKRPLGIWLPAVVVALGLWATAGLWGYHTVTSGPAVPSSDQTAPVAAALIVDNGPTLSYRSNNKVRLELAKEYASWVLDQLPIESRVGILAGAPVGSLALDPASADTQIKLIESRGARVDLLSRVRTALDLVLASELERKEIYVITDLMASAWDSAQPGLREMLDEYQGEVLIQIIDVGGEDSANWSLGDPQPDLETLPSGGDVTIEIDVTAPPGAGADATATVELWQEAIDPTLPIVSNGELVLPASRVVARQVVDLSETSTATVTLSARNLESGTHHFTLRLDKNDPLDTDNERYVSVLARAQQPTLIVADNSGAANQLAFVADPRENRDEAAVDLARYGQLGQMKLDSYSVVCLFDPPPLTRASVDALQAFVEQGGGLLTILGPQLGNWESARGNPLLELLPGKLGPLAERPTSNRTAFLSAVAMAHPLFQVFGETAGEQLWISFPVFRNWTFTSLNENAQTILEMSDDQQSAVLSESRGQGLILTFTTPIPEFESADRPLWNELWIADDYWPSFALLLGAFQTLGGANQEKLNYSVSTPVSLPNNETVWPSRYELFMPDAQQRRVVASDGQLLIGSFEQPGIYRLRGLRGDPVSRGFSVNALAADTRLSRVGTDYLDEQLGADNYRIARDRDEVESSVGQARFGRELFPLMMLFVAGLFLAEQAMSNRFYKLTFRGRAGVS